MMGNLYITLLGKFDVKHGEQPVAGLEAGKTQELLAYLLLFRERPHCREKLVTLLWENSARSQSKGYLRQTLWQLQAALGEEISLLQLESDWIQINKDVDFWFDVDCFEQAYLQGQGIQGKDLTDRQAAALREAITLYRGDLLENWYQDWCIIERERLQSIYLAMLEKLAGYCEAHHCYDTAIEYGMQILRCDLAHERTYRRLMRLHYLTGNRTAALRTFDRCKVALDEELGVPPSWRTLALYKQIRTDWLPARSDTLTAEPSLLSMLDHLLHVEGTLSQVQEQVTQEINAVRKALSRS